MKVTLSDKTNLYEVIQKVRESEDPQVEVTVVADSVYDRHSNNLAFLQKVVHKAGKTVKVLHPREATGVVLDDSFENTQSPMIPAPAPTETKKDSIPEGDKVEVARESGKRGSGFWTFKKFFILILLISLLAAGGAGAYVYYYLPRAVVTLFVGEKALERSNTILVDPKATETNLEEKVITGKLLTAETQESADFSVTGKKTTGDKAHGLIIVENFGNTTYTVQPGSKLTASGNTGQKLEFSSTNSGPLVIPPATETMPKPGTKVVEAGRLELPAEAVNFGEDYNVAADIGFSLFVVTGGSTQEVKSSDLTLSNPSPFSGGTTREVNAVSAEDIKTAQEQLRTQALAGMDAKLKTEAPEGYEFEKSTISNATKFVQFNHEVGDEATTLTGTIKLESSVISYHRGEIEKLLRDEVLANVPEGFELSEGNVMFNIEEAKVVGDKLQLTARMTALVVPQLDEEGIRNDLVGKSFTAAEAILKGISQTEGFDIRLWPNLPAPFRSLPHVADRLEVKIEVKK